MNKRIERRQARQAMKERRLGPYDREKQRRLDELPQADVEAFSQAFQRFDKDKSGYLDKKEILACLRELGLRGSNTAEKRDIRRICSEAAAIAVAMIPPRCPCGVIPEESPPVRPPAASSKIRVPVRSTGRKPTGPRRLGLLVRAPAPGSPWSLRTPRSPRALVTKDEGSDGDDEPLVEQTPSAMAAELETSLKESFRTMAAASHQDPAAEAAEESDESSSVSSGEGGDTEVRCDLYTLALTVVPQVRERLMHVGNDQLLRQFYRYDRHGSGRLNFDQCADIVRNLGLDHWVMREIFQETHGSLTETVDYDEFAQIYALTQERVERAIREYEHHIRVVTGINDEQFMAFRQDIVFLYDLFVRYDKDGSGGLGQNEIAPLLLEFGLLPRDPLARHNLAKLMKRIDRDEDGVLDFSDFLKLIAEVRTSSQYGRREELMDLFHFYDKDGSGALSIAEVSRLLCDVGLGPKSRKEQREAAALIRMVDVDGSDFVDFEEFQVLCQRIDEKFRNLRYEEEVQYACKCGFPSEELFQLRWIFDSLDTDASGCLDAGEIKLALTMLQKSVLHDSFECALRTLDQDQDGSLDFLEFIEFVRLLRDGEGLFAEDRSVGEPSTPFSNRVKHMDVRTLRWALELAGLSKAYLIVLSAEKILPLFCSTFGVSPDDNLQDALQIHSMAELLTFAAARCHAKGD